MFTGLVECTGKVLAITPVETGARFTVEVPFANELSLGDSVAVNGCCLTVDKLEPPRVEFDLLTQTLRVTSLGALEVGGECNLERAMGGAGRFGGHFVMGHIDTTGEVLSVEPVGQDHRITISIPAEYAKYVIDKGSIAMDGVSLTIANITGATELEFWITPHTWQRTSMHTYAVGQVVNIEVDMLAKYVEKMFSAREGKD